MKCSEQGGGLWDGIFGGLILLALFLVFLVGAAGCASTPCPPPEVVTVPEPVEVPVLVKGEPLPICRADLETCNQELDLELVKCIGRNIQALVSCHQVNVGTISSHNKAIE